MFAPAVTAIREYIEANYTALPIRWQNEGWGDNNPQETASPFIEIEIIGGNDELHSFATPGNNLSIHDGLIRFYIFSPWNSGMAAAMTTADELAAFMKRKEFGQVNGQTIRTLDFSVDNGAATEESGNFAVTMCGVLFDFYYPS